MTSKLKVAKDYNGKEGGTLYRGTNKAILYKVKGVAKPMLSEDLYQHILKIMGETIMTAKQVEEKIQIGVKKTSSALGRMVDDGLIQSKIECGCTHYFKTNRCMLQDIFHPLPKFIIKSTAKYNEKWFIKKLGIIIPKQTRKRGEKDLYKKYGD